MAPWTGRRRAEGTVALMLPETEATLQDLRPDHLSPLEALPLAANRDLPHLRIDAWECGRCRNTTALQLKMSAKVTDEQIGVIRSMNDAGQRIAAIARATGLSRPTVYKVLGD